MVAVKVKDVPAFSAMLVAEVANVTVGELSPELITYVSANANSFQAVTCAGIGSIPFEISVESHD